MANFQFFLFSFGAFCLSSYCGVELTNFARSRLHLLCARQRKQELSEQEKSEILDKPMILDRSREILKGKKESELPAYARLYYLHRKQGAGSQKTVEM